MMTWEEAVEWLRQQPEHEALVRACYYDDPVSMAAQRFAASSEWQATRTFLPAMPGLALDIGAGRGISSYALAKDGWAVIALEPDPGALVGAGAIHTLTQELGLPIQTIEEFGETLPFADATVDLVYCRQLLHHAHDLPVLCSEVARVLKPGGRFIAVREHVISQHADLALFLTNHPLHSLYGGENAYLLTEYTTAICQSGLRILRIMGPYDNAINYFPMSNATWRTMCQAGLTRRLGHRITNLLTSERHAFGKWLLNRLASRLSARDGTPGRLYSFVAERAMQ